MGESLSNSFWMGFFLRNNQSESQLHYGYADRLGKSRGLVGKQESHFPLYIELKIKGYFSSTSAMERSNPSWGVELLVFLSSDSLS